MSNYTLQLLIRKSPKYAMRYLCSIIDAHSNITYNAIAERLKDCLNIKGKFSARHIVYVAGPLQDIIHSKFPEAPLINVLIVRADSNEASSEVDSYLKKKFRIPDYKKIAPETKTDLLQRAAREVYKFKS